MGSEYSKVEATHKDEFYRMVFENVRDPILVIRPDGRIIDANNAIVTAVGYSKEELLQMTIADLRPASEKPKTGDHLEKSSQGATYETIYLRKDGSVFPVEISTTATVIEGELTFLGIIRDITRRKMDEERLLLTQFAVDHFVDSSIWLDQSGRIIYVNDATCKSTGYDRSELLSMYIWDIDPGYTPERYAQAWQTWENTNGQPVQNRFESVHRTRSGKVFPVEITGNICAFRGRQYFVTYDRDITDRKRAEEALREGESNLERSQEMAHIGSFEQDVITGRVDRSAESYRIFGVEPGQARINYPDFLNFIVPEDRERVDRQIRKTMETGEPYTVTYQIMRRDGKIRTLMGYGEVARDPSGRIIKLYGNNQDITERVQAEERLRNSERVYRAIGESIDYGVWINEPDGRNIYASESFLQLVGQTQEQCSDYGWGNVLHPDEAESTVAAWKECVRTGSTWYREHRYRGVDGEYHPILARGVPVKDEQGKIICWAGINLDISDLKEKEAALLNAITQADLYMDLMGHDINNINQAAMGFLELALMTLEAERKLGIKDINLIERPLKALQTSSALIENVRKIKKLTGEGITVEPVDLSKVLKELDVHSLNASGRDITINIPEIPHYTVRANDLLRDAITNLITNAVKHSHEDKPLVVGVNVEPASIKGVPHYRCTVEDNGPGIPDEVKEKLFHRFERGTTRAHGKGLGLYLVRTLVEGYSGKVWVEDRVPGDYTQGAMFVILLPAAEK